MKACFNILSLSNALDEKYFDWMHFFVKNLKNSLMLIPTLLNFWGAIFYTCKCTFGGSLAPFSQNYMTLMSAPGQQSWLEKWSENFSNYRFFYTCKCIFDLHRATFTNFQLLANIFLEAVSNLEFGKPTFILKNYFSRTQKSEKCVWKTHFYQHTIE